MQELRGFLPVLRRLAEDDGMSSDERDIDDRCFYSNRPIWRHPTITDWLHSIDSLGTTTPNRDFQHGDRRRQSSKVDVES